MAVSKEVYFTRLHTIFETLRYTFSKLFTLYSQEPELGGLLPEREIMRGHSQHILLPVLGAVDEGPLNKGTGADKEVNQDVISSH